MRVTRGDREFDLPAGESTFIPVETRHRLENSDNDLLALIEVACGDYIQEDDIVRFDDKYGARRQLDASRAVRASTCHDGTQAA